MVTAMVSFDAPSAKAVTAASLRAAAISEVVVSHQLTLDLQGAVGLGTRYELTAGLPISYVAGEGLAAADQEGVALGDVRLGAKMRLAGMEEEQAKRHDALRMEIAAVDRFCRLLDDVSD